MQELSIEKSEDLILPREIVKFLESENKFSKDDIFNKQKLIDKLLENNNKVVNHQSHHVLIQYIQGSQSGPVNGIRSPNDRKYKRVDNNSQSYYMETSQLNWKANQLIGFYIIRGFTEMCFYWKVWLLLQGSQIICALSEYQQAGCLLSCRFSY